MGTFMQQSFARAKLVLATALAAVVYCTRLNNRSFCLIADTAM